jgi:hypothetical protein
MSLPAGIPTWILIIRFTLTTTRANADRTWETMAHAPRLRRDIAADAQLAGALQERIGTERGTLKASRNFRAGVVQTGAD